VRAGRHSLQVRAASGAEAQVTVTVPGEEIAVTLR
jgi:hypothetical protein